TFAGWKDNAGNSYAVGEGVPAMIAEDVTYTAQWTINQYEVTWVFDNGTVDQVDEYDFEEAVTKPADPEKTGYTFAGWKDNAGNSYAVGAAVPAMIAEDVTYTAQWTVNGYKVTWVYNDGVTEDVVETYNYGATINAPATPDKKVGYTFNSWSPAIDATMPAYDVTYTATWDANSYDAVFNANGGEWADGETTKTVSTKFDANIDTTTVGLTKDDAAAPTKAGYVFAGWDPAVGTMNSVDGLTFTAKWVNATDTRYTVITYTMNTEGQHVETDRDILTGETGASVDATPANLGAGFKFNAEKSSATGNILADSSLVLEVYIDRETYTLTTIVDDVTTPTKYLFEQTVSVTQPSKTGYDFAGWVDADNSAATVPATMPANDVTLKATWDARNDTVFYVVMNYTDDLSGDVTVEDKYELAGTTASTIAVVEEVPAEAAENTTYVLISDIESYFSGSFAINHYDFDKADSDVKVLADGTAEVNVYYVPAEYEITFSSGTGKFEDGETSKTVTLKYNQLVKENAPADPAKDGYTFKGYNGLTDTTRVAGKRTFTATYEANTYKLTWVIDKDTDNIQSSDVATDTLISAPAVNDSMKEGYKFMGWSDVEGGTTEITVPNAMPAGDSTYYAIWQIQQYKVTFYNEKGDAESIFTTTADYATEYTVPTASKTGYTFDKWMNAETDAVVTFTDGKGTIPSADTSYYATWTINQYTISFDTDGGSPVADIKQNYATPVTAPSDPTKIGYTFKGWATTKGADESAKVDLPTEMPAEDQTYYAIWVIDKYEIKFDSQGGSNVDTVKADYNSQVAEPTAPTKDGYTFKGWATTAGVTDAAQAVAFPVTMPLNGTTYYAIWETNNYTITFDSKGGSAVSSIEQPYLSSVAKPADPTLEGYTFGGWSATDGGTEAIAFPVEMPLNGATYYAIWTIESYTVNWINEGTTAKSETVNYKGALTAPEVTKTGYKLEGWYDADGNKAPATISDIGNTGAAITYTAKWTANTYDAIFDANGGAWGTETTKTVPTAFDQPIVAPENPSRAGYTFSTWEPAVGTMNSVDGLTFKAVWVADSDTKYTVETYTMNTSGTYDMTPEVKGAATDSVVNVKPASVADGFVLNDTLSVYEGQVLADNSLVLKVYIDRKSYNFNTAVAGGTTTTATPYLFGATVVVPEEEAKTGYTFDGWYYGDVKYTAGADFTMPAKDVTLTGTLTINKYTATWVFDNGTPDKVETYEYNATIVAPADPEKTGYTFASWSPEVDATMPAGDVTYTAQWTPNQYTITFENTGDTTIAPITQAYLSDVTAPADPEKAGHTFAGWLDKDGNKVSVPAKMPLDGMTLTADWTVNKYLVTFYKDAEKTETVYSNEVEFGASLNGLTADPTKEGHTFAGWAYEGTTTKLDLAKETVPVGGVNLVALWTVNNVKLVYRTYNGVYEEYEVPFGTAKADIPVPADPERDGWTFTGWNIALPETMPATQVTRVAQWKQETYTINWVSDGEKVTGDEFIASAVYGDELTAPEMSKTGYTFGGWDYNGATYAAGDAITIADAGADGAEITITAKWTANTYDAIFDANGGAWADNDTTKTVPTVFDQAIVAPENPSRAGYTFGTWEPTVGNMTAEGMTFKAVWVAKGDTQYKVITYTMNTDGDYVADNNGDGVIYTAATDSVVNVKPASVAEGFALNDSKSVYEGKVLADNSLVLKVYIDRETYTVTTTLDGTVTGTQDVLFGATVAVPADGVKEGYKFNGWTVNGTAYESNATFEMPAKDVAIVGTYTVNQYDAVFYVDGTVFATVPTNFGEVPAAPDATNAKPGYTFVEWTPALAAMTTAGAEYNAVFTAKGDTPYTVEIYTMGLDGNYGEAAVENYTGATDTEATYAPVAKEGFTVADTSVLKGNISADGKLVLKVYYSRNDYTITYNVDGEEYKVETYKYGADITILEAPKKEGHTFSGWDSTLDATMPAENLVINGTFSANDYTITYNVDGAEYKVETHKYGDDITILEAPKKEGHTFSGWDSSLPATMPAENLVISGTFSPNTYKITYMIDGAEHKVEEYVFGTPVTTLKAPEKEGYTFSGWDKNAPETMTAGDITISGTFTVNQYDAIFYVDGAVFATVPTNFGEVPAAPDATNAKAGYTFVEWTPALAAMTTAGAEYNAVFTANSGIGYVVKTYKMNTDGETYTMTEEDFTGTAGDTATYAVKTLEGFTFEKGTNYNEDANTISGTISGDGTLVLEVYYTRNKANVNINGEEEEKYYGEEIEEPTPVPEEEIPDGYEQDGWVDENGDPVEFPVTVGTEDIVIKPNIVPSEYTATFVFDDGTTEEKAIAYLSTVTAPDAPAKEGYKFIGWRDDTNKFLTSTTTMPARDITYTAIYEITTSVVIYYVDGEVVGAASYEYGAEILTSIPTYTTSVGYELDGWYTDSAYTTKLADGATFGSGITALYGKEVAKTYDAIFMVDGEVYKTVPTAFDADIVAPEAPTKDGYTFAGWDPYVGTMDKEGMTFTAQWVNNEYTITYIVDGEVYDEFAVEFGGEFEIPSEPDKAGYAFLGWASTADATAAETLPEFMPAENLTYYAVFEITERTATFYGYEALDASPYKSADAVELSSEKFNVGAAIEFPADPTNIDSAYWTFLGWSATENGEIIADTSAVIMGEEDVSFYAVYEKVKIKLVPADDSDTVIERDGEIECHLDGTVTDVPYETPDSFDEYYIYGLTAKRINESAIRAALKIIGDGRLNVIDSEGGWGTGTIVELYDKNGTEDEADDILVEQFYIVIFGDFDGNTRINAIDSSILQDEVASPDWSKRGSQITYLVKAADLDGNRRVNAMDLSLHKDVIARVAELDQIYGEVI
ncbi:MAG: InlB B-repeat-containing protein, partial [Clostridia bacterium]|nr:InlB B-repeat-containing protein [Clostridia bacterium]